MTLNDKIQLQKNFINFMWIVSGGKVTKNIVIVIWN